MKLMLCGDVMLGRGVDQILPHPGEPTLYERYVPSALDYVALAEEAHGSIPWPVPFPYVWGAALTILDAAASAVRIVNLETAVTRRGEPEPKGINYRMTPENLPVLTAANIDCCVLANNHVLDWGELGLIDTLDALHAAGLKTAGAGRSAAEATAPAVINIPGQGRVLVYAFACPSSGVPRSWAAGQDKPGASFLAKPTAEDARCLGSRIAMGRQRGDLVVLSVHWGPNWGYEIPETHRVFARTLIDTGGVDIVHGHSSHHPKAVEIYRDRPILYGCGDFLNDYEGISGYEEYRGDLVLLYVLDFAPDGKLADLSMVPFITCGFQLRRTDPADTEWLRRRMARECKSFGRAVGLLEGPVLKMPVEPSRQ